MTARAVFLAAAVLAAACSPGAAIVHAPGDEGRQSVRAPTDEELESLLRSDPELAAVLDDAPRRRLQVLIAVTNENAHGERRLRRLGFRVDAEYFYPASSVKLATAVAAIEKLDEQRDARGRTVVDLSTPLRVTEGEGRRRKSFDTTMREEIERSLVFSDNDAHNRLFELVGRDKLAERMARIGLGSIRIVHHLGDAAEGPPSAFEWLPSTGEPIPIAQRFGFQPAAIPDDEGTLVGTAHVDETGRRVPGPMDFSGKNRMTLRDLQDLLIATVRPDLAEGPLPRLTPQHRTALLTILGTLPSELRPGRYAQRHDDLQKPLHGAIVSSVPDDRVRVLSKGGRAFGFAVENAYAVDETTGRSFFVAAVMYANGNDTLNDDHYEYRTLAEPFMCDSGKHSPAACSRARPRPIDG